ncbi:MAG: hypothetical protein ACREXM_17245 [Gammaproteobacteria bacterium]
MNSFPEKALPGPAQPEAPTQRVIIFSGHMVDASDRLRALRILALMVWDEQPTGDGAE